MDESSPSKPYADLVKASSLGKHLADKPDNVAEILVQDKHLKKVTEIRKDEDLKFALAYQISNDIRKMKDSKTIEDFLSSKPTSLEEILNDVLRFREAIDRKRSTELVNTGKIRIETEEKQPRKKRFFGLIG